MSASMSTTAHPDPGKEYARRLEARRRSLLSCEQADLRFAVTRFSVFVFALVLGWLSLRAAFISPWWLFLPAAAFLPLVVLHEKNRRARNRMARAISFYERGISRLSNHWAGAGEAGDRFQDKTHPYSEDLDLFGRGSLFELISTARTRAGEDTLARWLKQPAAPEDIRCRQAAVEELRGRIDLREDLAILGTDVRAGVNPEALAAWGRAAPVLESPSLRFIAGVLASVTVLSLAGWLIWDISRDIFILAGAGEIALVFHMRKKLNRVVGGLDHPMQDLTLLAQVLLRLEREPFTSPRLVDLAQVLAPGGFAASRRIAKLDRLRVLLDSRRNLFFAPFAALLLWEIQMAYAIEAWRRESGPAVARWLDAVGEMEALCSLAGHAFEHPDDPFPEISGDSPCFNGKAIGHPLLPEETCVRNDVTLCRELSVLIVSGSNMSGKSTLLRTIGANIVLALAGAPVRAVHLKLSPVAVGASIQRRDSLQEGTSRFYAEITRLKQLVEITAGPLPLLYLLDELLSGTNSHDRSMGAEAVITDLMRRGAIGLLTTHDLALARIADVLAPRARNVHFEDNLLDGRLTFDYRLRSGIVSKSNALELMRSIGLDV